MQGLQLDKHRCLGIKKNTMGSQGFLPIPPKTLITGVDLASLGLSFLLAC
jgi:hypothetical protein